MSVVRYGAVIALLIAAVGLTACGGSEQPGRSQQVDTAQRLLGNSAQATGKLLSRTNTPAQLKSTSKALSRQLDPVDRALRLLTQADVTDAQAEERRTLTAAARQHRRYVVLLTRATTLPPKQGRSVLNQARLAGRQTRDAYARYQKVVPGEHDVLAGVDLTDTLGIAQAMDEQITDEKRAADAAAQKKRDAEAAAQSRARSGASSSGCNSSGGDPAYGPAISCVRASISGGGTISATVDYCDRTPGLNQHFRYEFTAVSTSSGSSVGSTTVSDTTSRACRSISSGSIASMNYGSYYVRVTIYNETVGVSGGSTSNTVSIW